MKTRYPAVKTIIQVMLPLVVVGCLVLVFSWRTHGFEAFTTYSNALEKASPIGKPFAEDFYVLSEDSSRSLLFQESDHYTLVGIVFFKCEMICPLINQRLFQVYREIELEPVNETPTEAMDAPEQEDNSPSPKSTSGLFGKLQVMTLSFDSKRDDVADLIEYKSRFLGNDLDEVGTDSNDINPADPESLRMRDNHRQWLFTVADCRDVSETRQKLLEAGFWYYEVMPGMFNHSPYMFLIGPDGTVRNVYDPGRLSHTELMGRLKSDVRESL